MLKIMCTQRILYVRLMLSLVADLILQFAAMVAGGLQQGFDVPWRYIVGLDAQDVVAIFQIKIPAGNSRNGG